MTVRLVVPKRRTTLVAICTKCSGDARAFRRAFRRECAQRGIRKTVRIVKSSCLDICPKRAVAVAIADRRPERSLRYLVVSSEAEVAAAVSLAVD